MATLRDVAKEAAVSVTTASAALRGDPAVKAATRDRVLRAAETVHYTANLSARYLKQGRSNTIAFVVPDISYPYFAQLAAAVSIAAARRGLQTIIQQTNASTSAERDMLRRVDSPMCDGLILNLHGVPESELHSLIGDRPAVLFEDYAEQPKYDNVSVPLAIAFRTAFTYLKERGYEHAAVVGGNRLEKGVSSAEGRNTGIGLVVRAMIEAGLGEETDVIACDWTEDGGHRAAAVIAQNDLGYDVLYCMNDLIALGLMRGLHTMGIEVPRDKAVFGYDGIAASAYSIPQLSNIAVDFDDMAEKAVSMLVERINGRTEAPPRSMAAGFRLVRGESA